MTKRRNYPGKESPSEAKLKFSRHKACPDCFRSPQMCICNVTTSFENTIRTVILQHPQEQYKMLNSARLARFILKNSSLRVGLSWPNFKAVAGPEENPSDWGILYLKNEDDSRISSAITVTDRKKRITEDFSFLRGIIALDGSWKQAKAMWWRNPWFLRLNRVSLNPDHPSLRKQVKKGALSTIEALALTLELLGEDESLGESMRRQYEKLIVKPVCSKAGQREEKDRPPAPGQSQTSASLPKLDQPFQNE
ncbi:MAG: DTW domain-containing protein [Chitinispirillaceae bacterium]